MTKLLDFPIPEPFSEDLPVYPGPRASCSQCGREFILGEVISVNPHSDLVFCYHKDSVDGVACLVDYTLNCQPAGEPLLIDRHVYLLHVKPPLDLPLKAEPKPKPKFRFVRFVKDLLGIPEPPRW